jgi:hypothetical protein
LRVGQARPGIVFTMAEPFATFESVGSGVYHKKGAMRRISIEYSETHVVTGLAADGSTVEVTQSPGGII